MFLGKVLRRARLAAGIRSAEALAEEWGYERTVIAKAESGQRPPSLELARRYAERFPELDALVESGLIEEWAEHVRRTGGTSLQKYFGKWIDSEKDAITLFYWAPVLIPGTLQTEAYARELLETTPSDEPLEVRLAERMNRKEVLSRSHAPVVNAIISEAALRRCVGGQEIMREQLLYLADIPYPKVIIQVIPAEIAAHVGLEGAASIAEQEGGPTIVYLDSFTAPQTTGEPEIVANVREITGLLRAEALHRGASRDLILRLADELHGKPDVA
jgi:DNA-binding XRE family transcriptional regulator